jgi:hypothetical protein
MSDKPISPLRQRMIEDMTVRNFVEKTRNDYIRPRLKIFAFSSCIRRRSGCVRRASMARLQRCASFST